jgi:P27 family predicted phage terminase small subunit
VRDWLRDRRRREVRSMSTRGPRPVPTALKVLHGNPGHRAINKEEPVIEKELVLAPDWMTDPQKKLWDRVILEAPRNLLKSLDESVLTTWVVACDLHRQASEAVAKSGLVVKSPVKGDPMQNPYLAIINKQASIMMKAAAEMGFTPSSRSRIVLKKEIRSGSKFSQYANS